MGQIEYPHELEREITAPCRERAKEAVRARAREAAGD